MTPTYRGSRNITTLAVATLLGLAPPLVAQNDDCSGAIAVGVGAHGPFSNVGATTSAPTWGCSVGGNDLWFSYTSQCPGTAVASVCGANFDTAMEVFDGTLGCTTLRPVACNADRCGPLGAQSEVSWMAAIGTTYFIRVGGFRGATGSFPLVVQCQRAFTIEGVAEPVPFTGTLSPTSSSFTDGDVLRFNFHDPFLQHPGALAAVGMNVGTGPQSVGVTFQIPGFELLWAGSTPSGVVSLLPPNAVGAPDFLVSVPTGLFASGDTIRIQGLVLDPAASPLPVTPTDNALTFTYSQTVPCLATEGFEGTTSGTGNYPVGWTDGGGTATWASKSGGTLTTGTGPGSAFSGARYMYCETSGASNGTFIMNTRTYTAAELVSGRIAYQLSRVGATIGTLDVWMDDGTAPPTLVASHTGAAPGEWNLEVVTLPAVPPTGASFQFHYTGGGSFRGDLAIDDFCTF